MVTPKPVLICFSTSQVLPTVARGFISHGSSDILVILSNFVRPDSLLLCCSTPVLSPYRSMALGRLPRGLVCGSVFQ